MKRFMALIVAILFVFAVSSVAIAQEKPAAKPADPAKPAAKPADPAKPADKKDAPKAEEKKAEKAKTKQVTGEVAAVDAAAKSITVKGKKADVTMSAEANLLADVKVGDKVIAKYAVKDGKNVAKSIKKAAAKKAADKPKADAKPADKPKADAKPADAKPAEPAKKP